METPVAARAMNAPATWQELRHRLEARRAALNAEIAAYPGPITGCDAQFNHLLEERSGINLELKRLDEARGDAAALRQFVNSCEFISRGDGDDRK